MWPSPSTWGKVGLRRSASVVSPLPPACLIYKPGIHSKQSIAVYTLIGKVWTCRTRERALETELPYHPLLHHMPSAKKKNDIHHCCPWRIVSSGSRCSRTAPPIRYYTSLGYDPSGCDLDDACLLFDGCTSYQHLRFHLLASIIVIIIIIIILINHHHPSSWLLLYGIIHCIISLNHPSSPCFFCFTHTNRLSRRWSQAGNREGLT